jgi:RNA polymerase sigma-70 factor (ECF subfamily)
MSAREQNEIFAGWMRDHRGILFKVARSFSSIAAEQDDLVQEIMLAVWKSVPHFNRQSRESSYIYRVALNRAISWRRRKRAHEDKLERYEVTLSQTADTGSKSDARLELVYAEIRKLEELDRSIILMHLDGFKYEEIAETLGLTVTNVGVRLNRIKKKLMENLKGK